ncbi:TnsA endonuclease N-terminal domain-containing protein [Burkholderia sp. Ac-20365]|uniref:TnsA endonuclease N-terminal domain-containing protein n=1 Tax=Burkholderia sp. Ac-20365 TaxID=2703897 RepID=UPI00197BBF65|nr:TnsA endonuclease N-terminal domain-containing protein [Burkholderia sp. Ac-20365]MBN3762326.1 heteromeric transposase endonuclease subunit TnsA [Burkholderia sp. Ac-20365]
MTEDIIDRWKAEGRGSGNGSGYKPWLEVFDFSSTGKVNRIYSPKLRRVVHVMSTTEERTFYGLEWLRSSIEIKEQCPLDRDLTLEIASILGIKHPYYPGTNVPTVMTVDFLVTSKYDGCPPSIQAYDCKIKDEAEDSRSIEKLSITQAYFGGMDIPHRLIFDSELPTQKLKNIEWIRAGVIKPGEEESYAGALRDRARSMTSELQCSTQKQPLNAYCESFEIRHGLNAGDGLRVAKILLYDRVLLCDLNNRNLATCPLAAFRIDAASHDQRASGM